MLISRPETGQEPAVTIKADENATHSYNDIGSFVIGVDGVQPVGDSGGPGYSTGETLGPHRLDSRLLNSFGPPVPEAGSRCRFWFEPCLAGAKVTGYTWHCNRHTFCSWLAMSGVSIKEIQELAGHKTIAMSARSAHLSADVRATASERMVSAAAIRSNRYWTIRAYWGMPPKPHLSYLNCLS